MVSMIQKFHINMLIQKKNGHEWPDFGVIDFSDYVQNSLLKKHANFTIGKRKAEKDETLQFGRSIKIDYPSKVTCEKIKEIISHIPGINSSISVSVTEEIS